ncbi:MAG: putative toxin-antitoxin system toxin component, PIN family [bacterium]|nr:putative toxin-antitoxin system toxin component, PIN family [bacterium]
MRVVFDTNILVLYFKGDPATAILEAAFSGLPVEQLSFFYSEDMFQEYENVLNRLSEQDARTYAPQFVADILAGIRQHGHPIHPMVTFAVGDEGACTHEPDNRFLECAVEANANYIVTVNDDDFPTTRDDVQIVGPSEFRTLLFSA